MLRFTRVLVRENLERIWKIDYDYSLEVRFWCMLPLAGTRLGVDRQLRASTVFHVLKSRLCSSSRHGSVQ